MTELKEQDIHGTEWDYLIVLDACRYDTFEEVYDQHLEGDLKKVKSKGSATPEWLWKTFTSRYNYNYISANPYINSAGINLKEMVAECPDDWIAKEHFTNIVDAWEEKWDNQLGTVHPEDLTKLALEQETGSKTIIHYIQPHRPYISSEFKNHTWWAKEELEDAEKGTKRQFLEKTRKIWEPVFLNIPSKLQNKIKELMDIGNSFEQLVNEVGEQQVKQYYRKDLKLALENIQQVVEKVEGKVIVTADHGELLGENNQWGHPIGSKKPQLRNVPWLKVKGVKND